MQFRTKIVDDVKHIELISDDNILFSFAPDHGARLTELAFKQDDKLTSVLWEVSPDDCKTGEWCKNEILFPFPNRIDGGKYQFSGKEYQFPINEEKLNNALHGMLRMEAFEVVDQTADENEASVTLRYNYLGDKEYYPFPFTFDISYKYGLTNTFTVVFKINNEGKEALPFGLGWHPYFKLGDSLSSVQLDLPDTDHLILGERNLPTGEEKSFNHNKLALEDFSLDDCLRLKNGKVKYQLSSDSIRLKMEGSKEYRYLQLFTPEGLGTVAVEPMTSGVNTFNNKEGLRQLEAGELFEVFFTISVDH
ncbi:MAG: hypothetical protein JXR03_13160 [Cyclobacteriaceae bacterium]